MNGNLRRDLEMSVAAEGWRIALERISEIDAGVRPGMDMREVAERLWIALQQVKDVAVQALTPCLPESKPRTIGEPTPTPPENPERWQIWVRTQQADEASPQMFVWMRGKWMALPSRAFPLPQG